MYYGAIEAGGTKFVCAVSDEHLTVIDQQTIPTTQPEQTLAKVFSFFDQYPLQSLGIGAFGPVDINRDSATYGRILNTPKAGWRGFDFLGVMKEHYHCPMAWTTDVNAAAFGEFKKGNARGTKNSLYLTIGTGIGGGVVMNERIIEGYAHAEIGHLFVPTHPDDDFTGCCPFHRHCLEGLASGPALEQRYGKKGQALEDDEHVWALEAYYLAQGLLNCTMLLRPEVIVLGGGVMKQKQLFPLIREQLAEMINDYVQVPDMNDYIKETGLGDASGVTGCLLLAEEAAGKASL